MFACWSKNLGKDKHKKGSSVRLGEEHRLRVFENGVLRKIFGPKWEEATGK